MGAALSGAKLKGLLWLLAALLLGGAAALGLPFFARQIPWSLEQRLAATPGLLPPLEASELSRSGEAAVLLDRLIKRVYPLYPADRELPLKITIVRGGTVNAFATLGGRIYIYEGLIGQTASAEELAGILAHEIEHVRRRHVLQGVAVRLLTVQALKLILTGQGTADPQLAGMLLNMHFSREQEREADEGGLQRLHDGRIAVGGLQQFFERMGRESSLPTLLSDHPANEARAALLEKYKNSPATPIMTPAEWAEVKKIARSGR